MTAVLSIRSIESECLINDKYRCRLDGRNLVITDGINTWIVNQSELNDLEERLEAIIDDLDGKASTSHDHTISDITNLQSNLDEITTGLAGKAASSHMHEFSDIYKTIVNQDQSVTTKSLNEILGELQLGTAPVIHTHTISDITNLQSTLDGKANSSHQHEFSNIYKTIVNQDQTTTTKSLETILNEREADIRTFIQTKADFSHGHNATEVEYKENQSVKAELDRINSRISTTNAAGITVDLFDIIFGTALDAGLQYEVTQLQAAVAALEAQVAGSGLLDMSDDALEAFDTIDDAGQNLSWLQRFINRITYGISSINASLRGYANITTEVISPAIAGLVL